MNSKKVLFIGATAAAMTAAIAAPTAFADPDPVELNAYDVGIPFQQIVSAGSSVDMTDITYTMSVAPITYNNDAPTGAYTYTGPLYNQPIVIAPAGTSTSGATTATNGNTSTWDYTRTLSQLFGNDAAIGFPQAGMYEFSITEAVTGGSSADNNKWTYDNPTYKLQVLIENTTENGEITGRHYAGWILLELDSSTGQYSKLNSGATGSDGKAVFEADYSGTAQLNVSKVVSGDYASTTYAFPIQVTLYLPSYASDASITATNPANQSITATSGANTTTRVYDVSLKHGETATFTVPVGTTYQIVEDPTHTEILDAGGIEYAPEIEWTVDDGSAVSGSPLAQYTMSELQAISADIRTNGSSSQYYSTFHGYAEDGAEVLVTLHDGETSNHATLVDASAGYGLVFMMDRIANTSMNSGTTNDGGWGSSQMRTSLRSGGTLYNTYLDGMTMTLADATAQTVSPATVTTYSADYHYGSPRQQTTTGDTFFLASVKEVYGNTAEGYVTTRGCSLETSAHQFAYFANLGITESNYSELAYDDGNGWTKPGGSAAWWTRSASTDGDRDFWYIDFTGGAGNYTLNNIGAVLPCFCL